MLIVTIVYFYKQECINPYPANVENKVSS